MTDCERQEVTNRVAQELSCFNFSPDDIGTLNFRNLNFGEVKFQMKLTISLQLLAVTFLYLNASSTPTTVAMTAIRQSTDHDEILGFVDGCIDEFVEILKR